MNTAPGVCLLGWVKCREQNFTAGYTLYNYVCKKNNNKTELRGHLARGVFTPQTRFEKKKNHYENIIRFSLKCSS